MKKKHLKQKHENKKNRLNLIEIQGLYNNKIKSFLIEQDHGNLNPN